MRLGYFLLLGSIMSIVVASCSFNQKIKDGEMAYERKQYYVAIQLLEEELKNNKSEAVLARKSYLLGQSYMKVQKYNEAQKWFQRAVESKYGVEALMGAAKSSVYLEDYGSAIDVYKKIGEQSGRQQESQREVQKYQSALDNKKKGSDYVISKLINNSDVSEYAPAIFDENFLVFTSERFESTGKNTYLWTGQKFSDLFIMYKNGSEVKRFDSQINSENNDGSACFNASMNRMYFTRCVSEQSTSDDFCKIFVSNRLNGYWDEPQVLPFILDKINYGQPTLIENDSVLVFSSDLDEPGGPKNLYYAELFEDGTWSLPEEMPATINSPGNEVFPTGDKDTLYFSSDFWPGQGGFDIFKTYLQEDRSWSKPINMGSPINSGADDFSFVVDYFAQRNSKIVHQGYFVSSRDGNGKDDLYSFKKLKIQKDTTIIDKKIDPKKLLYITVKTFTPKFATEDEPNSGIVGKVALGETLIKLENLEGKTISTGYADNNGFYYTLVPLNTSVKLVAAKLGYLNSTKTIMKEEIIFSDDETSKTINTELILDKIFVDKEINLSNIYYDFDKWDIKDEAKPTLDVLVQLLKDNPQIKIQLASHTDCRGGDEYNQELSQRRAQSVVDYIVNKGVAATRLVAKGFGKSKLIDICECGSCTEEQHQTNRRTTFSILKRG